MICPYYKAHGRHFISCQRGIQSSKFKGDLKIHIKMACNSKYRDCKTYKYLERSWGHEKAKTADQR